MDFERARKLMKRGYKVALPNEAGKFYYMKPRSSFVYRYDKKKDMTSVFVQDNLLDKDGFELYGILDAVEKRWLKEVLRPFKKRTILITKHSMGKEEWIVINFINGMNWYYTNLPYFPAGKMYKGMKLKHHYNAADLGLKE